MEVLGLILIQGSGFFVARGGGRGHVEDTSKPWPYTGETQV